MVLLRDLCEELEVDAAVLVSVLHPDLGEDTGHRVGADTTVDRGDRAVPTVRAPLLVVGLARSAAQEPRAGELLDAHRQAGVDLSRLHRHDRGAQRGGAGGTRVRHVVDGDAGLADLLLQHLADGRGAAHEVARRDDADLTHGHAAVGERAHDRLRREVDGVLVRVLAELGHRDAEDPDVVAHEVLPLSSLRPARSRSRRPRCPRCRCRRPGSPAGPSSPRGRAPGPAGC